MGAVRADGRGLFPAYLFEVKPRAARRQAWDLYTRLAETPAAQAVHPLGFDGYPLGR
ncbi:hypothetical protein [Acidiphilium sp.]|uniref:hypothetical protein n=1 Tax=Acidiphilium sp. TaxID=527 RepID=UPI002589E7AA|nr:hypothetical protein [Acidiphilium sp.]